MTIVTVSVMILQFQDDSGLGRITLLTETEPIKVKAWYARTLNNET